MNRPPEPAPGRCATCAHCILYASDPTTGTCERIVEQAPQPDAGSARIDVQPDGGGILYTLLEVSSSFGCVLWTARS